MPDLPAVRPREVVAALCRAGFFVHHQRGSHVALRHRTDLARRVTVPMHSRDLKKGTLRAILRQAGVTTGEFLALL
ncbi:MAG: type II toxin-antitoxin system HicA family toxin [Planctomycetes bacterium]|nr:type II toxin-antitoxin system HicA family toxin [Planctomycetota bacterium]